MPEPRLKPLLSAESQPKTDEDLELRIKKEQEREKYLLQKYPDIANLEYPMERIIRKTLYVLRADIVIGDDASGRLPALLYLEIAKKVQDREEQAAKEEGSLSDDEINRIYSVKPEALFVAGFRNAKDSDRNVIKKRVQKLEDEIFEMFKRHQKVIGKYLPIKIVTDFIDTGGALDPIVDAAKRAVKRAGGYYEDIEIITMGIRDGSKHRIFEDRWGLGLVGGTEHLPDTYKKSYLSGVVRRDPSLTHAKKIEPQSDTQQTVNESRETIKIVAKRCWEQALAWKEEELESFQNNKPWFTPQRYDYSHSWQNVSSLKREN